MTLSSRSNADADERLTIEQPVFGGPLHGSAPSTPQRKQQRSIFAEYWKTYDEVRLPSNAPPKQIMEEVKQSPTRRRIIHAHAHATYTYHYETNANPFKIFGIEQDEGRLTPSTDLSTDDESCDSLNSYERFLKKNEGVKLVGKRSASCPSLSRSMATLSLDTSAHSQRKTQSDTALVVKTTRKPSCLRKSRFSFDDTEASNDKNDKNKGRTNVRRPSVSFEPRIKVHEFQNDLEKWAPNGWSNWWLGLHN